MSDLGSVAAAYSIVLGGLVAYVALIARRVRAARRTAQVLDRARAQDSSDGASDSVALPPRPSEPPR
jgi:hypothetical protein